MASLCLKLPQDFIDPLFKIKISTESGIVLKFKTHTALLVSSINNEIYNY